MWQPGKRDENKGQISPAPRHILRPSDVTTMIFSTWNAVSPACRSVPLLNTFLDAEASSQMITVFSFLDFPYKSGLYQVCRTMPVICLLLLAVPTFVVLADVGRASPTVPCPS